MVDLYSTSNVNTPNRRHEPNRAEKLNDNDDASENNDGQDDNGRMTLRSVHLLSSTDKGQDGGTKEAADERVMMKHHRIDSDEASDSKKDIMNNGFYAPPLQ